MDTPKTMAFTASRINALKARDKRYEIRDEKTVGLTLRITPNGIKTWNWYRKVDGTPKRATIGRFPEVDINTARKAAAKLSGEVALGIDPIAKRKQTVLTSMTLKEAWNEYLESKKLRPETARLYRYDLRKLSPLHAKRVVDITRDDVERIHRKLSKSSEAGANHTMRALRAVLNRAIDRIEDAGGPAISNPVKRLSSQKLWNPTKRKTTRVEAKDLPAFVKAVREDQSPLLGDFVLTLLGTGMRLGECSRLLWNDIDLEAGTVTLRPEETKAGRGVVLPLPEQLVAMLKMRKAKSRRGERCVFPSRAGKPLASARSLLNRVEAETGIRVTHHDLRRTFASVADSLGLGSYTIKRLLNHSSGSDVTAGYIAPDVEELRTASQRVADATLGKL